MKKITTVILLLFLVAAVFGGNTKNAVVTKNSKELGKNYEIYSEDVESQYKNYIEREQQNGSEIDLFYSKIPVKNSIINQLFTLKVIRYYAEQNKLIPAEKEYKDIFARVADEYIVQLKENPYYWAQVTAQFGDEKEIKERIIKDLTESNYIEQNEIPERVALKVTSVSEKEIIDSIKSKLPEIKKNYEEVSAKHLLVSEEATALKIKEKIDKKEISFEDAAKQYSLDTSNSSEGGNLGWFKHGQMVEEFEEASFNGEIGMVVGPVKTQFGYHLIKIEGKKVFNKPEEVIKEKDISETIEKSIRNEKFEKWIESYKKKEKLSLKYYEKAFEMMSLITELKDNPSGIETKIIQVIEKDVMDKKGQIITSAKEDLMVIYEMALGEVIKNYTNRNESINQYLKMVNTVNKKYLELGLQKLDVKIKELEDKLSKDENNETLTKDKKAYEDAKFVLQVKAELQKDKVKNEKEAKEFIKKTDEKLKGLNTKHTTVLRKLYEKHPESDNIIRFYYHAEPGNNNVKLAYAKISIEEMKRYFDYLGMENAILYLEKNIQNIFKDLKEITTDKKADKKLITESANLGLSFAQLLNYQEMIDYFIAIVNETH